MILPATRKSTGEKISNWSWKKKR